MDHDAAIAVRSDSNGQRDELAGFLAKPAGFRIRGAESLISLDRVGRQLRKVADARADFLVVLIPIHDHGFSPVEEWVTGWDYTRGVANVISSPVHPGCLRSGRLL